VLRSREMINGKVAYLPEHKVWIFDNLASEEEEESFLGSIPGGAGNFLFTTASRTALEATQPPIQWVTRFFP
jgi:hypothetical protein